MDLGPFLKHVKSAESYAKSQNKALQLILSPHKS